MNKVDALKTEGFSIGELFESQNSYRIPLYQRNFAWGNPEVKQLIRDIADFAVKGGGKNYYLGILVVYDRDIKGEQQFEVVDGQQRLTVLSLLMRAFEQGKIDMPRQAIPISMDLNFAHRPRAQFTLRAVSNDTLDQLDDRKLHREIQSVYREIPNILAKELEESGCALEQFYEYLTESVVLYRSPLPEDTELNHYFEVMNNRGEQLEKHEILKAKMMGIINEDESILKDEKKKVISTINKIWEYCSDMNRYVQYSFDSKYRKDLFGSTWNEPQEWYYREDFDTLKALLSNDTPANEVHPKDINSIINGGPPNIKPDENDDGPDRFQSVINFPNFLLQVLRIYQNRYVSISDLNDFVSLDDKVLLDSFDDYIKGSDFVKRFIVLLLKVRFLFDQYVIKRMYNGENDEWSLLKLHFYHDSPGDKTASYIGAFKEPEKNKEALMLLAMFHVSTPTQNYKHWLTGILNYLINQEKVEVSDYIKYMRSFSRRLFFDRFMIDDPDQQVKYEEVVFQNSNSLAILNNTQINDASLTYKNVKNNLVFNYLDYLIWLKDRGDDDRVKKFEFRFRSSVEHFNPRNPRRHEPLPENHLNSFGNLCLIAHGKNSSFSNNNPLAKAHSDTSKASLDSLKFHMMMKKAKEESSEDSKYGGWGPEQVKSHQEEMISMVKSEL